MMTAVRLSVASSVACVFRIGVISRGCCRGLTCPSSIELGDSRRCHTSAPVRTADRARGRT
jgi:hypothetical protein